MQKVINKYYKQKISRGRTTFARAVDAVALRILLLFAAYIWFRGMHLASYVSLFLAGVAVALASIAIKLWRDMRFERFITHERSEIARCEARSRLATMREEELYRSVLRIMREDGTINRGHLEVIQRITPVNADDIVSVYRVARRSGESLVSFFSTSEISKEAKEMTERLNDMEFKLYGPDEISERGGITSDITDDEIDSIIVNKQESRERPLARIKNTVFSGSRTKPYLILGGVLLLLSFFARGGMYYRIISSACFSFAVTTAILERKN